MTTDITKHRPLSSVAMHKGEDSSGTSRLYEMIEIFKDKKVYSYFGLSLIDFMSLPVDICDHILTVCMKSIKEDNSITETALNNLNKK
jgi:hypothetical protein